MTRLHAVAERAAAFGTAHWASRLSSLLAIRDDHLVQ
jgi:hypothetical protein